MHSDNKHTDKKLQELENLSLPDLSKMDEHWQQMKTSLQPASRPSSKPGQFKKLFRWMVAAVLFGGVAVVAYQFIYPNKAGKKQVSDKQGQTAIVNVTPKDSIPIIKSVPLKEDIRDTIILKATIVSEKPGPVKIITLKAVKQQPASGQLMLKAKPDEKKDTAYFIKPVPDNQSTASLAKFFKQLEKQSQQFIINNKKDTLIEGEDGTTLLIPANTFDSKGEVVITLKEFYSYEDIITNKLTTTSNGEQLITGGMIHLIATIDGKEVDIQPGKSIRWFIPDTTKEMSQMQLFTASPIKPSSSSLRTLKDITPFFDTTISYNEDTASGNYDVLSRNYDVLNWIPQNRTFMGGSLRTSVKVLNLKNEPMKIRHKKSGDVGIFLIADKPRISAEELQAQLKEKYDYSKVKIKKRRQDNFFGRLFAGPIWRRLESTSNIGDSAWISLEQAKRYNLQATDTSRSIQNRIGSVNGLYQTKTFTGINMDNLAKKFSVDIRNLGWVNCDRFINNKGPRIDYYVDLKDTAANYYTILVFDNIRSMIQGAAIGNRVVFPSMPQGLSAKVISIGIQNNKTVAAMEPVKISSDVLSGLKFEDTSPVAFKEDVKTFDK